MYVMYLCMYVCLYVWMCGNVRQCMAMYIAIVQCNVTQCNIR